MTSPDGSLAVVSDGGCDVTQVVDLRTRRVLGPIAGLKKAFGVAKVLPDNRVAVVAILEKGIVAVVGLALQRPAGAGAACGRRTASMM